MIYDKCTPKIIMKLKAIPIALAGCYAVNPKETAEYKVYNIGKLRGKN